MDAPWLLQQLTVIGFVGIGYGMAWRDDNPKTVAVSRHVLDEALRDARLQQKAAASDLAMDEGTFSRALDSGGGFFARVMALGIASPVFATALLTRMGEAFLAAHESPMERRQWLLRELDELSQREALKCEGVEGPPAWSSEPRSR